MACESDVIGLDSAIVIMVSPSIIVPHGLVEEEPEIIKRIASIK